MFKVNNKNTRTMSMAMSIFIVYFTPFSSISIVDFEQINVCQVLCHRKVYCYAVA